MSMNAAIFRVSLLIPNRTKKHGSFCFFFSTFKMSDELITRLNTILWSFQTIILPTCFILGNIGNILNLLIFGQRSSRKNSCLLYFLSASLINIVILNFGLPLRVLRGIWNIDPASQSVWFCRGRSYAVNSAFFIYRCSILLACLDRMCASSRRAWLRRISEKRVAHRLIVANWIFHFLYYIHSWIFPGIVFGQCTTALNTAFATYLTVQTLTQGLFIPSTMILWGWISVAHLKQMKARVAPQISEGRDERRVIGQFLSMLFIQVLSDFLCNIPYPCYLIYTLVSPGPMTQIKSFILNMSLNLPYLNYSSGFDLYTLSSQSFRRKLLKLFRQMKPHPRQMHTETNGSQQLDLSTFRGRHTTM
jgi:hypothetical protein